MNHRTAIEEMAILLREAAAIAADTDPVHASALLRQGWRVLSDVEDQEAREAERGREAIRELRVGLRSAELKAKNAVAAEVQHGEELERARATRSLKAEKALQKAKAAS